MGGSGWLFFSHGGKASGVFFRRASLNGQHANARRAGPRAPEPLFVTSSTALVRPGRPSRFGHVLVRPGPSSPGTRPARIYG